MKRGLAMGLLMALCALCPARATEDARLGSVYEIFVGGFYDSDGDGMGDLNGVARKLDYLEALKPRHLWLMPIMPSPSYHKYDVTDYCAVDSAYGSLADFSALAAACATRGVGVLIDLPLNHTSNHHPWFLDAAQSLAVPPCGQAVCVCQPLCRAHNPHVAYYHFLDAYVDGYHPVEQAEGWWYEGGFGAHMPDLNLDCADVREEILDICAFWLARGASGFRLDATTHYYEGNTAENAAFLQWLTERVRGMNAAVYFVAEAWTDDGTIARLYESRVDSFFHFGFSGADGAIVSCLRAGNGRGFAERAAAWQATIRERAPDALDAVFLSNHDQARSAGMLMRDEAKEMLAAAMYILLPGNAFVYYGEEIGMLGSGLDQNKRQPFVWSLTEQAGMCLPPEGSETVRLPASGADAQSADEASLLWRYRTLLEIKRAYPALGAGALSAIDAGEKAVALLKFEDASQTLYVAHNLSAKEVTVAWEESGALCEALAMDGKAPALADGLLTLPPYTSAVLAD